MIVIMIKINNKGADQVGEMYIDRYFWWLGW